MINLWVTWKDPSLEIHHSKELKPTETLQKPLLATPVKEKDPNAVYLQLPLNPHSQAAGVLLSEVNSAQHDKIKAWNLTLPARTGQPKTLSRQVKLKQAAGCPAHQNAH